MATHDISLLGAIYPDVPAVKLPIEGGGTATFTDVSDTTATASDVASGKIFYAADGTTTTGTASGGGGTLITKSITENGTYSAQDDNADGYSQVTVNVSGGGSESVVSNVVNFIDYDGTVLYSYTPIEFFTLSEMPSNPTHNGLTSQGWNWTKTNILTQSGNCIYIGQMYTTDDGKTRLYISIPTETPSNRMTIQVRVGSTEDSSITVDWGDGATETIGSLFVSNYSHTYASSGNYIITLKVNSGTMILSGDKNNNILGSITGADHRKREWLKKVEIGSNVTNIGQYTFYYCWGMTSITIPKTVTSIGQSAFNGCYSLKSLTIPTSVTTIETYGMYICYSLSTISIPFETTSIGTYAFYGNCNLKSILIPSGITSLSSAVLRSCYSLSTLTIPPSVNTIESYVFNNDCSLGEIHFKSITPPVVSSTNAFTGIPSDCKIYVPNGSLTAYTTAAKYPSSSTYTYVEE